MCWQKSSIVMPETVQQPITSHWQSPNKLNVTMHWSKIGKLICSSVILIQYPFTSGLKQQLKPFTAATVNVKITGHIFGIFRPFFVQYDFVRSPPPLYSVFGTGFVLLNGHNDNNQAWQMTSNVCQCNVLAKLKTGRFHEINELLISYEIPCMFIVLSALQLCLYIYI